MNGDKANAALETLIEEMNGLVNVFSRAQARSQPHDSLRARRGTILRVLEGRGPLTVPQLARICSTSRQNIQVVVNRLEAEGCVEFAQNPAHKRSYLTVLAGKGKELLEKWAESNSGFLNRLQARISESELEQATGLLRRIRKSFTQAEEHEILKRRGVRERRRTLRKPAKLRKALSVRPEGEQAESPLAASEEAQLNENELPYNLL